MRQDRQLDGMQISSQGPNEGDLTPLTNITAADQSSFKVKKIAQGVENPTGCACGDEAMGLDGDVWRTGTQGEQHAWLLRSHAAAGPNLFRMCSSDRSCKSAFPINSL